MFTPIAKLFSRHGANAARQAECQRVVDAIVKVNADAVNKAVDEAIISGFGTVKLCHDYELTGSEVTTFDTTTISDEEFWAGKHWSAEPCKVELPDGKLVSVPRGIGVMVAYSGSKGYAIVDENGVVMHNTIAPRTIIICAANDVEEMRRHYGSDYEVMAC